MLEQIAAICAIVGGVYGAYALFRQRLASRLYRKPLYIFSGTNELRDDLLKLRGRAVDFDTVLDFSIGDRISTRILQETEYAKLLRGDAAQLNRRSLPLYVVTKHQTLDTLASLIVDLKEERRLKFSHGGTGVIQVLLKGRFDVEARAYSGPSVEITLREL